MVVKGVVYGTLLRDRTEIKGEVQETALVKEVRFIFYPFPWQPAVGIMLIDN